MTNMNRKHLVRNMIKEGITVTAIAEALNVSRQRVYVIVRGYTAWEKQYRRHFIFGHAFHGDCPYCLEEQKKV